MAIQTVPVQIPEPLYHRLERLAKLTNRSLENVVEQALTTNLPPLPDHLPKEARIELQELELLNDDALWQVARSEVSSEHQTQISSLLEKNSQGTLTEAEQTRLSELQHQADQLMLKKAYAYVLLKWRGHRLPTLAELEA